jgi:hypothetical protein
MAKETEVLGENLPQLHSVHHRSYMTDWGSNSGCRGEKPAANPVSCGTHFGSVQ